MGLLDIPDCLYTGNARLSALADGFDVLWAPSIVDAPGLRNLDHANGGRMLRNAPGTSLADWSLHPDIGRWAPDFSLNVNQGYFRDDILGAAPGNTFCALIRNDETQNIFRGLFCTSSDEVGGLYIALTNFGPGGTNQWTMQRRGGGFADLTAISDFPAPNDPDWYFICACSDNVAGADAFWVAQNMRTRQLVVQQVAWSNTTLATPGDGILRIGNHHPTVNFGWMGPVALALYADRVIEVAQLIEIARDPWAVFETPQADPVSVGPPPFVDFSGDAESEPLATTTATTAVVLGGDAESESLATATAATAVVFSGDAESEPLATATASTAAQLAGDAESEPLATSTGSTTAILAGDAETEPRAIASVENVVVLSGNAVSEPVAVATPQTTALLVGDAESESLATATGQRVVELTGDAQSEPLATVVASVIKELAGDAETEPRAIASSENVQIFSGNAVSEPRATAVANTTVILGGDAESEPLATATVAQQPVDLAGNALTAPVALALGSIGKLPARAGRTFIASRPCKDFKATRRGPFRAEP